MAATISFQTRLWMPEYVNAGGCATTMRCVVNRHKSIFRLLDTMRTRCRLVSNLFLAIENYKCLRLRRCFVFLFICLATFTEHNSLGKLNCHWVCFVYINTFFAWFFLFIGAILGRHVRSHRKTTFHRPICRCAALAVESRVSARPSTTFTTNVQCERHRFPPLLDFRIQVDGCLPRRSCNRMKIHEWNR